MGVRLGTTQQEVALNFPVEEDTKQYFKNRTATASISPHTHPGIRVFFCVTKACCKEGFVLKTQEGHRPLRPHVVDLCKLVKGAPSGWMKKVNRAQAGCQTSLPRQLGALEQGTIYTAVPDGPGHT